MKLTHWKIKNEATGTCYFVPIHNPMERVLDAIHAFMKQHAIRPQECRILESGAGKGVDAMWKDFVLEHMRKYGA